MKVPKKILLIQTAFPGDVILATALIESIHQCTTGTQIDFLVRKGNSAILHNHPALRSVIEWDKRKNKLKNLLQLLSLIRKEQYDAVFNLHRFASSGFLTAFSGAGMKIGFSKNPFSFLFTHSIAHTIGDGKHETERNLELAKIIFDVALKAPRLYPGNEDKSAVKVYQNEPYICIAPGSVWFTKTFPESKWIDFLVLLQERGFSKKIFLLGASTEHALCERIRSSSPSLSISNLAGKLSFLQSACLMEGADQNYVNDSAPLHLASAMNAPVTAVYCSTVPAFGFGPLSERSKIVETREELSCRPCGLHGYKQCPEQHFRCALTIAPHQLISDEQF